MNKIVFLEHFGFDNDCKILGFFNANDIESVIEYYSKLPGFSSNKKGFDASKSVFSDNDFAFLLQIWSKDDEHILTEGPFASESAAKACLKKFSAENDMTDCAYQIEKYTVNQKYWIDGYITC